MITDQCNLNCNYCYVRSSLGDMDQEIFQEAYDFIENKLRKEMIDQCGTEVSFFGGEPLLNMKLLNDISYSPYIRYVMPTNGILLTEKTYDDIVFKKGIKIGISYDGKYGNTYNRVLKSNDNIHENNMGSYLRYDSFHFSIMRRHGCKTMLYPNMFPLLKEIYDEFRNNKINSDFTLIRDDIYNDQDIINYDKALTDLTDYIISTEKDAYYIPGIYLLWIRKFLSSELGYKKQKTGCFAGFNGVGIKPNGMIYPCIRFTDHEISDIRTERINYDVLDFFRKNLPAKIEKCRKCNINNICTSQCFYSSLKNGGWQKVVPIESVCQLFRISLRESLRLLKNMPTLELIGL